MKRGLFVGLTTLDLIYLTENYPNANEKTVALDRTIAAGGPATNAAVCFAALGGQARLYSSIGQHPIAAMIRSDLEGCGVDPVDLTPAITEPPSLSSIVVTRSTGERAVVSLNATRGQADPAGLPEDPSQNIDIVLLDGHQIAVGEAIARQAKERGIPAVIDGGSWKAGFERILPHIDHAIVSADFFPPSIREPEGVFAYLENFGIPRIAITRGEKAILWRDNGREGTIGVTPVRAIDTLGAGDIFHGAFCHYILQTDFPEALSRASEVAAFSCRFFGTRRWREAFRIDRLEGRSK
jgi:sugar/nucleoside kinase (ribokinase family)